MNEKKIKQKLPRYEMHKYWGKKPYKDLEKLILKYSKKGDIVFDPFAGYGVFLSEALLNERNVIGNDLNPFSNFIMRELLNSNVDIDLFNYTINEINNKLKEKYKKWYISKCKRCGLENKIIASLRNKDDTKIINKVKCSCSKETIQDELTKEEIVLFLNEENDATIIGHPFNSIMKNSRIGAKEGMTTDDLFTKRSLICHSALFNEINDIEDEGVKNLAKLAFTKDLKSIKINIKKVKNIAKKFDSVIPLFI